MENLSSFSPSSQINAEDACIHENEPMETDIHSESYPESEDVSNRPPEAVANIEDMVVSFLSQLVYFDCTSRGRSNSGSINDSESEDIMTNPKNNRTKNKIELRLVDRTKNGDGSPVFKSIKYPRKCAKGSIRPMAQLFRILDLAHEAVVEHIPTTKRDIYYKDTPLFKSQRVVDSFVDDLAATFDLERSDLNIRAASKGLICGSGLAVYLLTGEILRVSDTEGFLIPAGEDIQCFSVEPDVAWVLIVEKEAVFQTLCRLKLSNHPSLPGRGLIITGKGYPDVATRHLVKTLADALPTYIPILAMVDGDPYGMHILYVYKYGSRGLQHESAKLAASRIEWLGLWATELKAFGVDRDKLLPITKHDEKKALSMLRKPMATMPLNWRKELMHMLHSRRKAEIEVLSSMKPSIQALGTRDFTFSKQSNQLATDDDPNPSQNNRLNSYFSNDIGSVVSHISPTAASNICSNPPTNLPPNLSSVLPVSCSTSLHAPLMRYLAYKITEFVGGARARADLSSNT